MIWKIKNEDIRKSALWALISIPMSFIVFFLNWIFERGDILGITFFPTVLAWGLLGSLKAAPGWGLPISFIAQYLGYFLLIYVLRKIFKFLKKTGGENAAKVPSEGYFFLASILGVGVYGVFDNPTSPGRYRMVGIMVIILVFFFLSILFGNKTWGSEKNSTSTKPVRLLIVVSMISSILIFHGLTSK